MQQLEIATSSTIAHVQAMHSAMITMDAQSTSASMEPSAPTLQSIASTMPPMEDAIKDSSTQPPTQQDTASISTLLLLLLILLTRMDFQLQQEASLVTRLHVMEESQVHTNAFQLEITTTSACAQPLPALLTLAKTSFANL